jgi:tripartite-type tricarboxylate transporter receptor subunit TctC
LCCSSSRQGRQPFSRSFTFQAVRIIANTVGDTPAEFQVFLKKDYERWARVIKAAGVKAE